MSEIKSQTKLQKTPQRHHVARTKAVPVYIIVDRCVCRRFAGAGQERRTDAVDPCGRQNAGRLDEHPRHGRRDVREDEGRSRPVQSAAVTARRQEGERGVAPL